MLSRSLPAFKCCLPFRASSSIGSYRWILLFTLMDSGNRGEMHAGVEWHKFEKEKDTLVGQKSSKCKQASLREIKATLKVKGLVWAHCSIEQHLKKERERKEKRNGRHQRHATKHLTRNLDRFLRLISRLKEVVGRDWKHTFISKTAG